ncbi:uncharacterized protein LOC126879410 [Diabrotica virgifera virgifera]|uniref:Uncharacterized protein LOC114338465 n=1 Tax=Diabrotica virgifera virgifera TaxID=50390 RepID=A0A6P7GI76_DIAVI|nr:uncharacterized protein LOC126879410 [Diabrotica virgifera virgifera]
MHLYKIILTFLLLFSVVFKVTSLKDIKDKASYLVRVRQNCPYCTRYIRRVCRPIFSSECQEYRINKDVEDALKRIQRFKVRIEEREDADDSFFDDPFFDNSLE